MTGDSKRAFFHYAVPDSDPDISRPRLIRDGSFLENDWREIAQHRRAHNRLGFAYQVAFVRVLGRFPQQEPLEIDDSVLRFDACAAEDLARFLEGEAQRMDRTASLLARAWLRDRYVLAPGESVLRRAVGSARQAARASMVERMEERLFSGIA